MFKIKNRKIYIVIFSIILIVLEVLGFFLQSQRALETHNFWLSIFALLIYFTNQSNILIFLVAILILTNLNYKWIQYLSFVTLINIIITSIVFNIFLLPLFDHLMFVQILLHSIIPIIYVLYYFIFLDINLSIKHIYISLIYPIIYMLFVYLIYHPFIEAFMISFFGENDYLNYVYPFLNPANYNHGFISILQLTCLVFIPLILILSWSLLKLNHYIKKCFYK